MTTTGEPIDDRVYEKQDFDRELVIKERTEIVAKKITQFLKETDRYSKTIVFCVDIDTRNECAKPGQ